MTIGVQKILLDMGVSVDDPILLKAIEEKAFMVFILGQSVKAVNGIFSAPACEQINDVAQLENNSNSLLEDALLRELHKGKSLHEIERENRIFLIRHAFSKSGERVGRFGRAAETLKIKKQTLASIVRRMGL